MTLLTVVFEIDESLYTPSPVSLVNELLLDANWGEDDIRTIRAQWEGIHE